MFALLCPGNGRGTAAREALRADDICNISAKFPLRIAILAGTDLHWPLSGNKTLS